MEIKRNKDIKEKEKKKRKAEAEKKKGYWGIGKENLWFIFGEC